MKKAVLNYMKKNKISFLIFIMNCFILFNFSCGLESFYYLDPPKTDGHINDASSSDAVLRYFSFLTTETGENSQYINSSFDFSFQGTEVYYKIYNDYDTMLSVESYIDNLNLDDDVSNVAEILIDSKGYVPLATSMGNVSPLIPAVGTNRYVYIRLNDLDSDAYRSVICVSNEALSNYDESKIISPGPFFPRRSINMKYGFNFNSEDEDYNPLPKEGDEDVTWTSVSSGESDEEGLWYVDMYAVSKGRDSSYTTSYSKVLFLGSVVINESDYNK